MWTYVLALLLGLPFCWRHVGNIRQHLGVWIVLMLLAGGTNTAYVLAVINGEVMRVALLFYLAPLWTLLFARLMLGERPTRLGYWIMLLALGGALVMLWRPDGRWPLPSNQAEWLGLAAGVGFAFTNVLSRKMALLTLQSKSLAIWVGGATMPLIWLVGATHLSVWVGKNTMAWGVLAAVALTMFSVTWLMQYGLASVAANRAIVILLSELVVSALSAYLLAGESLVGKEWLGAAMIMAASVFSGRMEQQS